MTNLSPQPKTQSETPSATGRSLVSRFAQVVRTVITASLAVSSLAVAAPGDAVHSNYPYADPYFATVTVRLMHVSSIDPKVMSMPGLLGRDKVPLFVGKNQVDVAVYAQPCPAPLLYLIPGMGGGATDGAPEFMAEKYFKAGFNVLIMPSPFTWQFVIGQSTTGLPGYTPDDIKDLTRLMMASRARAEHDFGMQPTRQAVVGYSLGAIQSAYLMKSEREHRVLGLERAVLINPPLALSHTIGVLDRLNAVGDQWTPQQRDLLWGSVVNVGAVFLDRDINNPNYFLGLNKSLLVTNDQLKYLIGNTFRQSLSDVVFSSQQLQNSGLLKLPATNLEKNARESEAERVTFADYLTRAVAPAIRRELGRDLALEQLIARGDMASIRELVTHDPAFRLVHNADDFLNDAALTHAWIAEMGPRAVLFPHGGHVGNLWSPDLNQAVLNDVSDLL